MYMYIGIRGAPLFMVQYSRASGAEERCMCVCDVLDILLHIASRFRTHRSLVNSVYSDRYNHLS